MNIFERITARAKGADDSALYRLHPELSERVHVISLTTGELPAEGGGFKRAATDYAGHVWVHKAVAVIADAVAPLPLQVRNANDEQVDRHPLAIALADVNDTLSSADLWRQWATDMLLGGESGVELVKGARGGLVELWPRQPNQFTVITDKDRKRYYGVAAYRIKFDAEDRGFELPRDEFVHFKFYNPVSPWRGLAPIQAARMGIVIDQLAQAWSRLFFSNNARPDYAVIAPQGITQSEKDNLELQLISKFGGTANAHRPIILEDGITDVKTFSFPPKDTEWVQQRQLSREEISGIFGVPDEIMGFGRNTYENFETARRVLWTLTLVPMIGYRDTTLTEHFRRSGLLRTGERVATDLSKVTELQEDLSQKVTQGKTFYDMGVPFDLINDRLGLGFEAVPGGDLPYAGRANAGPFGLPVPTRGGGPVVTKQAIPAYGSPDHRTRMKALEDRQQPHADTMQSDLKRQFQRQQIDVGRALRNQRALGNQRGLDAHQIKLAAGDVFSLDEEIARFEDEFRDVVDAMLNEAAAAEYARLDNGHLAPFEAERQQVQDAIQEVLHEMSAKVNQTTFDDLTALFQEAERNGESIPEISERLSEYFGGRKSDYEVERIARTTMVGADNSGAMQAYDQSGVVSKTAWLATIEPGRTREAHIDAHGQVRLLGENFDVGGESLRFPGDPNGSAGNIINCRCGVEPIVE